MHDKLKKQIRDRFWQYVETFTSDDPDFQYNIELKKKHTARVVTEAELICTEEGFNKTQTNIAVTAALLHDIGRFDQYRRYRTYIDRKSEDHGALGRDVILQEDVLRGCEANVAELILKSVYHHNKAFLPKDETEEVLFYTRIVRDADKLDIYKLVSEHYSQPKVPKNKSLDLALPDEPDVSEGVLKDLKEKELVNADHLRTLNDFKFLQMGWVYDINFDCSMCRIKEKGYLRKIFDSITDSEKYEHIYASIEAEVDRRACGTRS